MNINIQSIHFKVDDTFESIIKEKLQKLQHYFDKITAVEVYLKLDHAVGEVREKHVELKLIIPGTAIFSKDASNNFEHAFELAYNSAKKQLVRRKELLQA